MKYQVVFLMCFIAIAPLSQAQTNSFRTIKEAINYHITKLKQDVGNYDNIFVSTTFEEHTDLSDKVYQIENGLHAPLLKKGDTNYFVKIIIYAESKLLQVDFVNFRVIKKSRKDLLLLNLSTGSTYYIKPS